MDDFSYTDTSAEVTDQIAASRAAARDVHGCAEAGSCGRKPRYRIGDATAPDAAFKITGGVQKTSTLVQWAKAVVIDVAAKKTVLDEALLVPRRQRRVLGARPTVPVARHQGGSCGSHDAATDRRSPCSISSLRTLTAATVEARQPTRTASYLAEVTAGVRGAWLVRTLSHSRCRQREREAVKARALRDCNGCDAAIAQKLGAGSSAGRRGRGRVSRTEYTLGFQLRDAGTGDGCSPAATAACAWAPTIPGSVARCAWLAILPDREPGAAATLRRLRR